MILTVDELREHVTTELGDDAVQRLLDAAEAAIAARAGTSGARTERVGGGYRLLSVLRPISSITSITERIGDTLTTLAADDYQVYPGGMVVERLHTGTNQRSTWGDQAIVIYTPTDDDATRQAVQIQLVTLAVNYAPGVIEETIGEWTERFAFNSAWTPDDEREAILAQLDARLGMVVL